MKNYLKLKFKRLPYIYSLLIGSCFILLLTSLPACTTSFSGVLPTAPSWVSVVPNAWRNKDTTWVFASGTAVNIPKIIERRSIAEGKATQNLRQMLAQKLQRMMKNWGKTTMGNSCVQDSCRWGTGRELRKQGIGRPYWRL